MSAPVMAAVTATAGGFVAAQSSASAVCFVNFLCSLYAIAIKLSI